MANLDPYGSSGPRGWERQDEPRGWERRDDPRGWQAPPGGERWSGGSADPRAWHRGAAPEAYAQSPAYGPDGAYSYDDPSWGNGYARPGDPRSAAGRTPWPGPEVPGRHDGVDRPYDAGLDGERPDWHAAPADSAGAGWHTAPANSAGAGWPVAPPDPEGADRPPANVAEPPEPGRRSPGRRRAGTRRATGQSAPTGRAGRNLPAAIGVGLFLAAAVLTPLFLFRPAFFGVLALAVGVGIWEMARAVRARGAHPPIVPLIAGGVLMTGLAWRAGPDALSLGLLVTVLATMIWRLADGPAGYQRDLTAATLIAVYVPFLAGFAALLAVPSDGDWRVLVTLAAVVLSDTGGYVAGVFLGKHPMAPSVSPKKSWEGFAGSVAAAAAGSAVLLYVLFDVGLAWGALFGLAVSIASVLGDLGESMIKRDLGIKDMSNLLPGHGGLMDRLDSILFAVPTAYLLLSIFAPAT